MFINFIYMINANKHCIWLTFESRELANIINNLSDRFHGPVFQPHCTLVGKTDISIIKLKSAITNVMESTNLKEIHIENVNFSDNYWRSFYLELKEKNKLTRLHEKLMELLSLEISDDYIPHISLMYNLISEKIKKDIELPIELGQSIQLRSIQITKCDEYVENWKPVFQLIINN